jgi:hypothetical protein
VLQLDAAATQRFEDGSASSSGNSSCIKVAGSVIDGVSGFHNSSSSAGASLDAAASAASTAPSSPARQTMLLNRSRSSHMAFFFSIIPRLRSECAYLKHALHAMAFNQERLQCRCANRSRCLRPKLTVCRSLKRQAVERGIEARARDCMARLFRFPANCTLSSPVSLHEVSSGSTMRSCFRPRLRNRSCNGMSAASTCLRLAAMRARAVSYCRCQLPPPSLLFTCRCITLS